MYLISSWRGSRDGGDLNIVYESPYHIFGYYCDMSALSDRTVNGVLKGIGVRGHKVPANPQAR